jgi:nucleotide-binding universal stress UspA family protein
MRVVTASCRGVPFVEIVRRAREDQADLILVGRQSKRGFTGGLIGSTAERVLRKAASAVLVVTSRPSTLYRRPLIAVDLSPTSQRAAAFALRIVDPSVRVVDVIHVKNEDHQEGQARQEVQECLASVGSTGVEWNVIIRNGDARRVILDEAAERQSDLLVLGTHGRTAIAQLLIGSVAEAVVRAATRDILVVRPETHTFVMP